MSAWMILEIMGHTTIAGEIENVAWDGQRGFVRVKVPATPRNPAYVKDFGVDSIFSRTPCSESVARRVTEVLHRTESRSLPVYDSNCLNDVRDPMAEVDLESAREKDVEKYGEHPETDLPF